MKNEKRKKNRDRLSVTRRLCDHVRAPRRLDIANIVYQPEDIAESAQVHIIRTYVCVYVCVCEWFNENIILHITRDMIFKGQIILYTTLGEQNRIFTL